MYCGTRWTLLQFVEKRRGMERWKARCECGTERVVNEYEVRKGNSKSCGCYKVEVTSKTMTTHGHTKGGHSRTYRVWSNMVARCSDEKNKKWKYYGGKGVTVCDRWRDFNNFLADMGEAPEGLELDRRDSNGNYEPDNCRWATEAEQIENRCCTIYVEHGGERLTLTAWAQKIGVDYHALYARYLRGDTGEKLLRPKKERWDGIVEYRGERRHYREWADILGIDQSTLYYRLRVHNVPVEEAMKPLTQNC